MRVENILANQLGKCLVLNFFVDIFNEIFSLHVLQFLPLREAVCVEVRMLFSRLKDCFACNFLL